MKRLILNLTPLCVALTLVAAEPQRFIPPSGAPSPADDTLANYFRHETEALATRCLTEIKTLDDWKSRREEYRRQLQEMLGLWPMPERTDLKPVITGRLEQDDFTVEKLHFQASPQLYVTANLYLPKKSTAGLSRQADQLAPAILYVCGHSRAITNGVSFGNKTGYQRHGAWFARNGYVCLMIDTLQLGEIQGEHRGTHTEQMWWWNSRGYTPAGVEAWFGIRALDYLCSRPEVDKERIGMTGRSGGGSYSWTVAALDDRVKVVCPVAGITDLQNHVVDNCIDGHCDCMFFLNSYRWDFPRLSALIAPRPLLVANSDKDRIFPLDGVMRIHEETRRIYGLYGAKDKLGLLITEGPHEDTQDLQLPVFRWFNRFLKGEQPLISMAASNIFQPAQLKVFNELPVDAVNTNLQAIFVPKARPRSADEVNKQGDSILATLKEKTFGGWPAEDAPLDARRVFSVEQDGIKFSAWSFLSQHDVELRLYFMEAASREPASTVALNVFDQQSWTAWLGSVRDKFGGQLKEELLGITNSTGATEQNSQFEKLKAELTAKPVALAFFAPRGVGLTAWSGGEKRLTQIRRRFMLLGQTLDGMRVWDVRRAIQTVHFVRDGDRADLELRAPEAMSGQASLAALFEPGVRRLDVAPWTDLESGSGDYFNISRLLDAADVGHLLDYQVRRP